LKPDVLKPDVLKPDVLKPDVLWVYPKNTLPPLKAMITDVMANLDREVIILVCKKFRSWIEADMEAIVGFIK
jgi:hypothetical protein